MNPESHSSSSDSQPANPPASDVNARRSAHPKSGNGYVSDVDNLINRTPLSLVLQHYGLPQPQNSTSEYRMKCVFNEACSDSQYGNLTVRQDVAKQIYCHSCETRGNLLTLVHGLETQRPPEGGRLRGQEFKAAIQKLRQISGEATTSQESRPYVPQSEIKKQRRSYESTPLSTDGGSGRSPDRASTEPPASKPTESKPAAKLINVPLIRHDKEAARAIADLANDLIADVAQMSPEAAQ